MIKSIFSDGSYNNLATAILERLKRYDFDLSNNLIGSTRVAGDTIENVIAQEFSKIISETNINCSDYSTDFARRAMADLAFVADNNYYMVDVKTHRKNTEFNMPNLTSVERLSRFYEDHKNYFVLFLVEYRINIYQLLIERVLVIPIEFLSWDCLTLGALGWGQIQIANSNKVEIKKCSRKIWMLQLCENLINSFYPKEALKISTRKNRFIQVREFWKNQKDIWKME